MTRSLAIGLPSLTNSPDFSLNTDFIILLLLGGLGRRDFRLACKGGGKFRLFRNAKLVTRAKERSGGGWEMGQGGETIKKRLDSFHDALGRLPVPKLRYTDIRFYWLNRCRQLKSVVLFFLHIFHVLDVKKSKPAW